MPITSYGIILFKEGEDVRRYLMICRKDTFGYIDFLRGKYSTCNNTFQLQNMIDEMSLDEKRRIQEVSFNDLWMNMWCGGGSRQEESSAKKFEFIRNGFSPKTDCLRKPPNLFDKPPLPPPTTTCGVEGGEKIHLVDLVKNSETRWTEPEWEFPKGRKNNKEKELDCALREFEEETGISRHSIHIVENVAPFEEIFIGTNYKSYKHKYYLAKIDDSYTTTTSSLLTFQKTEVSEMRWKTLEECLASIRPYHVEKKKIIQDVDHVLNTYVIL